MRRLTRPLAALLLTLAGACFGGAAAELVRVDEAHRGGVIAVAFVRDGQLLSAGSDSVVRLWVVRIGSLDPYEPVGRVGGRVLAPSLAVSADGGQALVPGGLDGALLLWDVAAQSVVRRWPGAGALARVALGEGITAAGALDGEVTVWQDGDGAADSLPVATLRPHAGRLLTLAIIPGPRLLTAGDDGRLCATSLSDLPLTPEPACVEALGDGAAVVAFSPDGARAAVGSPAGTVHLWETATGRALGTVEAHEGSVTALAFAADGARLLTGGADRRATVVDVATGALLGALEVPGSYVASVAVAPDGARAAIGADDGTLVVWRMP